MIIKEIVTKEKYSDALERIKYSIVTEVCKVDLRDCSNLPHISCSDCPLGDKDAPLGDKCLMSRIENIFNEAIVKCKEKNL